MKKGILLFIVYALISSFSWADNNTPVKTADAIRMFNFKGSNKAIGSEIQSPYASFEINEAVASDVFKTKSPVVTIDNFPISGNSTATVVLNRIRSVVDSKTKLTIKTNNGPVIGKLPEVYTFTGAIKGEPNSNVFINYFDGKIMGFVQNNDEQFNLVPFSGDEVSKKNHALHTLLETDFASKSRQPFLCGTNDVSTGEFDEAKSREYRKFVEELKKEGSAIQMKTSDLIQVNIMVEGEYLFFSDSRIGSNVDRATAYIISVMSHVSKIYEDNVNIRLYISEIIINSDSSFDPYIDSETITDKLSRMADEWQVFHSNKRRALAVLFANKAAQPPGDVVAGIAYSGNNYNGVLCNVSRGYAVFGIDADYTYPTFNYTWDVSVACHELGHNFGNPHTHNCYWETDLGIPVLDTCIRKEFAGYQTDACYQGPIPRKGTIMSYCHLTNGGTVELYFHPVVAKKMRGEAEDAVADELLSCVFVPSKRYISLLSPLGSESINGGFEYEIQWTHQNVGTLEISYSSNGGNNWDIIASGVSADDSTYKWLVPANSTKQGMILIKDEDDPEVYDMSMLNFTVKSSTVNILNSPENKRLGHYSEITVSWELDVVQSVDIQFSSNGGNNWETLEEGFTGLSYKFFPPQILSENCKVRIVDSNNDNIFDESGTFAVGAEVFEITRPADGDVICTSADLPEDQKYEIRWQFDFLEDFYLYYRPGDADDWKRVSVIPLNAGNYKFEWNYPKGITSETAQFKVTPRANTDVDIYVSHKFKFDSDCIVSVDPFNNFEELLNISSIIPNPASGFARIEFEYNIQGNPEAAIKAVDINGRTISIIRTLESVKYGMNTVDIDLSSIPQGAYFIVVEIANLKATAPLSVVR